jgi:hypothetical protein
LDAMEGPDHVQSARRAAAASSCSRQNRRRCFSTLWRRPSSGVAGRWRSARTQRCSTGWRATSTAAPAS